MKPLIIIISTIVLLLFSTSLFAGPIIPPPETYSIDHQIAVVSLQLENVRLRKQLLDNALARLEVQSKALTAELKRLTELKEKENKKGEKK